MSLVVELPETCRRERDYIVRILFGEYLGLQLRPVYSGRDNTCLVLPNGHRVVLADGLFSLPEADWMTVNGLPKEPLVWVNAGEYVGDETLRDYDVPVLYGPPPSVIRFGEKETYCDADFCGSAFFMLSGYEEWLDASRDRHDRFESQGALASRAGFLHLPVVDLYVEMLRSILNHACPGLIEGHRVPRVYPTHDVDRPFEYLYLSISRVARLMAADVVRRRSPVLACRTAAGWWASRTTAGARDINNTFDYMMRQSERLSLASRFFFIAGDGQWRRDFDRPYAIGSPEVMALMSAIASRGHAVSLHLSYNSYCSSDRVMTEAHKLSAVCDRLGLQADVTHSRQHYLRWRYPDTLRVLEAADICYDYSLGYPDRAGFRRGTCREFPVYDLADRRVAQLRERPFCVMDTQFIDRIKLPGAEAERACEEITAMKTLCRQLGSDFSFLWHNSSLVTTNQRSVYECLLDA